METIPTPAVERETKKLDELERGDWIKLGYLNGGGATARVLGVFPFRKFGQDRALLVYHWHDDDYPENEYLPIGCTVGLAAADEIPEDPNASGRELDKPAGGFIPDTITGVAPGAPAGRVVAAQDRGE